MFSIPGNPYFIICDTLPTFDGTSMREGEKGVAADTVPRTLRPCGGFN